MQQWQGLKENSRLCQLCCQKPLQNLPIAWPHETHGNTIGWQFLLTQTILVIGSSIPGGACTNHTVPGIPEQPPHLQKNRELLFPRSETRPLRPRWRSVDPGPWDMNGTGRNGLPVTLRAAHASPCAAPWPVEPEAGPMNSGGEGSLEER